MSQGFLKSSPGKRKRTRDARMRCKHLSLSMFYKMTHLVSWVVG